MNVQGQRFSDTRGFRIAVIAVVAVVVLGVAASLWAPVCRRIPQRR